MQMLLSRKSLEPAVFGVARPVLLWPAGFSERLDDAHVEAILAHELCHVRRRDNLAASLHMAVEAIFWFHPLVWWLGARLVDERERACDETVLQSGSPPQVYAESILRACEFCVRLRWRVLRELWARTSRSGSC
jgi:bla regulator protein blaR1